jgi:hypothetical protein
MTEKLSQKPRPKTGIARAPIARLASVVLTENQRVKLSVMRVCVRCDSGTGLIPKATKS